MTPKQIEGLSDLCLKTDHPWTAEDDALVLKAFREAVPATREEVLKRLRAAAERKEAPE